MKAHQFIHEMRTTSAIFGRKHDIQVTFKGDRAYTDGKVINLPSLPPSKTLTTNQVRAMRGYVDHEAGHIRHSDMPRVMEFYDRCLNNDKAALKDIHNCLEDHWMEARVMEEYAGAQVNLKTLNELMADTQQKAQDKGGVPSTDWSTFNHQSVCGGISTVGYENNSGEKMKKLIDDIPVEFQDHVRGWVEHAVKCENTEEVITLAKSVYKLLEENPSASDSKPEDFDPQSGEGMDEGENSEEYKQAQAQGKEGEGNPFDSTEGKGKKADGKGKDGEPAWAKVDTDEALNSEAGDGASGSIGRCDGDQQGEYTVGTTEKDVEYKRGIELPPFADRGLKDIVNSTDVSGYDNTKAGIRGEIMTMKNKLKRALLAKKQRDWDPGREVGRLDSKRMVAAYNGSKSVFKQRIDREEEDTVVTILVDLSGSMYGGKDEVARDCVVALSECLSGSEIKFNVVGFCNKRNSGSGYNYFRVEALDTVFFKDFDTPLRVARGAINQIPEAVGGNNSDYDFITNAINDLSKRHEERKVLLVLSDGHPAHAGNGAHFAVMRHCKNAATKDAKKAGVECIGIGICDSAVKEIYPDHVVVHNVNDLAATVFHKLTKILIDGSK